MNENHSEPRSRLEDCVVAAIETGARLRGPQESGPRTDPVERTSANIESEAARLRGNDFSALNAVLASQALALDTIFTQLAREAVEDNILHALRLALEGPIAEPLPSRQPCIVCPTACPFPVFGKKFRRTNWCKRESSFAMRALASSESEPKNSRAARSAKGWTQERRARQAERARLTQPWRNSTGPKTEAGKARVAMNAFRHGYRGRAWLIRVRRIRNAIRLCADTVFLARVRRSLGEGGRTLSLLMPSGPLPVGRPATNLLRPSAQGDARAVHRHYSPDHRDLRLSRKHPRLSLQY